jgi:hypothetical protein
LGQGPKLIGSKQPSGKTESFTDLPVERYITIIEGVGIE